jgi:Uma2 family endonuclease
MAGGRNIHNQIASNILGALHAELRGKPRQPYNSDTKIRIKLPTHVRFYYPDVSVFCDSNPPDDTFQDRPTIIVEVLSTNTRRADQSEQKEAYLTISTLSAYLLIEQDRPEVCVYRRTDQGFVEESYQGLTEIIRLSEIEAELSLAVIYERVEFMSESNEQEI